MNFLCGLKRPLSARHLTNSWGGRRCFSSINASRQQEKESPSLSLEEFEHYNELDRKHVMHPYTSMTNPLPTHLVKEAKGVHLYFEDGRKVIDGMSSWWAAVHGYCHPVLDKALLAQSSKMSHVMFGGLSHRPAIDLCKLLVDITPAGLEKVFLCDSGSVSVEVAMKMAVQYWFKTGKPDKSKFLTITNGYHGDTFGAMSVCDPVNGMHGMFKNVLAKQLFVESPSVCVDGEVESIQKMETALKQESTNVAAVILEPIVQGAGGMKFVSPWYLEQVRNLCDQYDVLLIADEIATGFGRTGALFACNHANVTPDILCLGKALTGGYMTMGATMTNDRVSKGISHDNGVFMHGPTFMGNPLSSSVALASVTHLLDSPWEKRVRDTESTLKKHLIPLKTKYKDVVQDTRVLGAIGVCELKEPVSDMSKVQEILISNGVWLRPFGKLLYTMPPFNAPIESHQVEQICNAVEEVLKSEQQQRIK